MKINRVIGTCLILISFITPFSFVVYSEMKMLDFKEKENKIKLLEANVDMLYRKKGRMYYALMLHESNEMRKFDSLKVIIAQEN